MRISQLKTRLARNGALPAQTALNAAQQMRIDVLCNKIIVSRAEPQVEVRNVGSHACAVVRKFMRGAYFSPSRMQSGKARARVCVGIHGGDREWILHYTSLPRGGWDASCLERRRTPGTGEARRQSVALHQQ